MPGAWARFFGPGRRLIRQGSSRGLSGSQQNLGMESLAMRFNLSASSRSALLDDRVQQDQAPARTQTIRWGKIERRRRAIAAGGYPTGEQLERCLDALMQDVLK